MGDSMSRNRSYTFAFRRCFTLGVAGLLAFAQSSAPVAAQTLGAEAGAYLAMTAGALNNITAMREAQAAQQQLLQSLNSQEARAIQANISAATMEISNLISSSLMPCLQKASVMSTPRTANNPYGKPAVLGASCPDPKADIATFEESLTCGNAVRAKEVATSEGEYQSCRLRQMELLQRTITCFDGFNDKMNTATQRLKNYISQRTAFAQRAIDAFNKNVDGHTQAIQKIESEVEGKGGYKDQVAQLDAILTALDEALNGAAGGGGAARAPGSQVEIDGVPLEGALVERVRHLSSTEGTELGNQMFKMIVGGTERCYVNGATTCDTASGSLPGGACLAQLACANLAQGPGFKSRCEMNKRALAKVSADIGAEAQFNQRTSGGNLDPLNPNQIIQAAQGERGRLEALVMRAFDRFEKAGIQQGFNGDISMLKQKSREQLDRCFALMTRQFSEHYNTNSLSDNPVRQMLEAYRAKQLQLEGDIKRWTNLVADRMTKFRTKFTNVFSNTLKQFASDCNQTGAGSAIGTDLAGAATGRSQAMLVCLQTLRNRLEGGLNGTNGEAPTTIQIPVISGTPGSQGATSQFIQQQCTGFKDCIQKLDVAKNMHLEQKKALIGQRQTLASEHNRIIDGIVDQASAAVNAAMKSTAFSGMLNRVNGLLRDNGIPDMVALKAYDADDLEKLEKDENSHEEKASQIYKNPGNLLKVMAARGGIQQLRQEDLQKVKKGISEKIDGTGREGSGIRARLTKADKVLGKARDKIKQCTPTKEDFETILSKFNGCKKPEQICNGLKSALGQMERIGGIIANDTSDGKNSGMSRRDRNMETFNRCIQDQLDREKLTDDTRNYTRKELVEVRLERLLEKSPTASVDREYYCLDDALSSVRQFYGVSRPDYRTKLNGLTSEVDKLIGLCETYRREFVKLDAEEADTESRSLAEAKEDRVARCQTDLKQDQEQLKSDTVELAKRINAIDFMKTFTTDQESELPRASLLLLTNTLKKQMGTYTRSLLSRAASTSGPDVQLQEELTEILKDSSKGFEKFMRFAADTRQSKLKPEQIKQLEGMRPQYEKTVEQFAALLKQEPEPGSTTDTRTGEELLAEIDKNFLFLRTAQQECSRTRDIRVRKASKERIEKTDAVTKQHRNVIVRACDKVTTEVDKLKNFLDKKESSKEDLTEDEAGV